MVVALTWGSVLKAECEPLQWPQGLVLGTFLAHMGPKKNEGRRHGDITGGGGVRGHMCMYVSKTKYR